MRKIIFLAFLIFFVHSISLFLLLANMNECTSEKSTTPDNGIYSFIAFFCSFIIYLLIIILVILEKLMKSHYKLTMFLLVYINCVIEFYLNSITQYHLFTNSERFNNTAITIIIVYFTFELFLTYYVITRFYKTE